MTHSFNSLVHSHSTHQLRFHMQQAAIFSGNALINAMYAACPALNDKLAKLVSWWVVEHLAAKCHIFASGVEELETKVLKLESKLDLHSSGGQKNNCPWMLMLFHVCNISMRKIGNNLPNSFVWLKWQFLCFYKVAKNSVQLLRLNK